MLRVDVVMQGGSRIFLMRGGPLKNDIADW